MQQKNVKTIIAYYRGIPEMARCLKQERDGLEDLYNGLHSMAMDGMSHGSVPGRPTEKLAEKLDERGVRDRIQEIEAKILVLEMDTAVIRDCLDTINGKYKKLLFLRYWDKYSWGKINVEMGVPYSTVRRWHDKALDRLGEALENTPMADEILIRAGLARL